jgi:hypothetical protein
VLRKASQPLQGLERPADLEALAVATLQQVQGSRSFLL